MSNATIGHQRKRRAKQVRSRKLIRTTSPSSAGMFMCCRRKAYYHIIRQLTLKYGKPGLEIGQIWHVALQAWYTWKRLAPVKKAIEGQINEYVKSGSFSTNTPAHIQLTRATIIGMFMGYLEKYGKTDLKNWNWLVLEHHFTIPNFLGTAITFAGIIDGVVEIKRGKNRGIWIVEHKTTKDLSYFTVEAIKHNIQTLAYMTAVQETLEVKPKGIIWNAVRKPTKRLKKGQTTDEYCDEIKEDYIARPDFYFLREQLRINQSYLSTWAEEITQALLDLELCFEHPGSLPLWYKNTQLCSMYGGCEFSPLCFRGEKRSTLAMYRTIER